MKKPSSSPDYVFITLLAVLVIFGLVMLASASSDLAQAKFGDSLYYLRHQIIYGLVFGLIGFFVGSFVYYRFWEKLALGFLLGTIILLLLVFTPLGVQVNGAERWFGIGNVTFQPGEIIKLTFIIYLAAWVTRAQARRLSFSQGFLPFLVLLGIVTSLLVFEPATTTAAILFAVSLIVYFVAGARFSFLLGTVAVAFLGLVALIYLSPYRLERVMTFLNPTQDALGASYHINQALIAIGSGGVFGVGYGQSTTKLHYLPEPIGDSIFAVIAEELGFVGSVGLLVVFVLFIMRGFHIARHAYDHFGRLLVLGFVSLVAVQTFINIAAISGIIPLTGVPLPFVSYGGTALAVFLTMSGIIVNVSKYR